MIDKKKLERACANFGLSVARSRKMAAHLLASDLEVAEVKKEEEKKEVKPKTFSRRDVSEVKPE